MYLAETNARLLADGTLRFQIPGYRRSHFFLSPWSSGFTALCVRGKQTFPAVAWTVAAIPPVGAPCERNAAVETFIAEIPHDACRRVQPYQFGQCMLLRALATDEAARDLADSNPNLFWLLAVAVSEGRLKADQIPALCRMKQANILRVLTRTGTKAQVRFLRKVRIDEGTTSDGQLLLEAAGNPAIVQVLRHYADIPMALVRVLAIHRYLASEELVPMIAEKVAECGNDEPARIDRLHRVFGILEFAQVARQAREFRLRLEELLAANNPPRLLRDAAPIAPEETRQDSAGFPPPPLPGSETIVPITSSEALEIEGRELQHCVASYADVVRAGQIYLYRVLAPQRGTLEVRLYGGTPQRGQFTLAKNRPPSAASVRAVEAWFSAACAQAKGRSVDATKAIALTFPS